MTRSDFIHWTIVAQMNKHNSAETAVAVAIQAAEALEKKGIKWDDPLLYVPADTSKPQWIPGLSGKTGPG